MVFTPFLGRMLGVLKKKEIYVLVALLFGCAAIVAIEKLIGQTAVLSKFLAPVFGIWVGFYIFGYVIDKIKTSRRMLVRWYSLAAAIVVIFGLTFVLAPQIWLTADGPMPVWNAALSALFYPFVAGAIFLFFKNTKIKSNKTKRAVEFVGNRAFGIYLIHFCFFFTYLHLLPEWLRGSDNALFGIVDRAIITSLVFLSSLVIATLVDLFVLNPIQKRLKARLLK